jgi:AcrR family transcriptional regulator
MERMAKSVTAEEETRTRARTRRAILDAAVRVLGDNPKAALSEVAEEAGVARSTLQRYFPERADLTCALGDYADELVREATERARTTEGTALEAFSRLVAEYFALQKVVMLAFGNEDFTEPLDEEDCGPAEMAVFELVERGHEEGTIDPRITPMWAQQLLWAGLYAGWSYVTVARVPAYEALNLCLLSLVNAMAKR